MYLIIFQQADILRYSYADRPDARPHKRTWGSDFRGIGTLCSFQKNSGFDHISVDFWVFFPEIEFF